MVSTFFGFWFDRRFKVSASFERFFSRDLFGLFVLKIFLDDFWEDFSA